MPKTLVIKVPNESFYAIHGMTATEQEVCEDLRLVLPYSDSAIVIVDGKSLVETAEHYNRILTAFAECDIDDLIDTAYSKYDSDNFKALINALANKDVFAEEEG